MLILNSNKNKMIFSRGEIVHTHAHPPFYSNFLTTYNSFSFMSKNWFSFFCLFFVLTVPAEWEFTCRCTKIIKKTCHFTHIVFINLLPPLAQTYDFLLQFTWKLLLPAFVQNGMDLVLSAVQGYIWIKSHFLDLGRCHQSRVCQRLVWWLAGLRLKKELRPSVDQGPVLRLMESFCPFPDGWGVVFLQVWAFFF